MEEKRIIKLSSRFSSFELYLLLRIAEIEQRKKADMLRELVRREALKKGLITNQGLKEEDEK